MLSMPDDYDTGAVSKAHQRGFDVRARGVADAMLMEWSLACGVDCMTFNFPDKLAARIRLAAI